jgi:hypothetical protein
LATELALRLQNEGQQVELVLVDGSYQSLQTIARTGVSGSTSAEWETNFLEKLMLIVGVSDLKEVKLSYSSIMFFHIISLQITKALLALPDWASRLAATAEHFPDQTQKEFHSLCVDAVQKRCVALLGYTWPEEAKITCPVTLIRTKMRLTGANEDYGLNEVNYSVIIVKTCLFTLANADLRIQGDSV